MYFCNMSTEMKTTVVDNCEDIQILKRADSKERMEKLERRMSALPLVDESPPKPKPKIPTADKVHRHQPKSMTKAQEPPPPQGIKVDINENFSFDEIVAPIHMDVLVGALARMLDANTSQEVIDELNQHHMCNLKFIKELYCICTDASRSSEISSWMVPYMCHAITCKPPTLRQMQVRITRLSDAFMTIVVGCGGISSQLLPHHKQHMDIKVDRFEFF